MSTSTETVADPPLVLNYRLTEADVRRYVAARGLGGCARLIRSRAVGLTVLVALGSLLVGSRFHAHGTRSALVAIGTTVAVLAGFAWRWHDDACRDAWQLARDLGLPLNLRVTVDSTGITPEPGPDPADPARTFPWSDVVAVEKKLCLQVVRFRRAGCVLIIPDRVFAHDEARGYFHAKVRAWRDNAPR